MKYMSLLYFYAFSIIIICSDQFHFLNGTVVLIWKLR